MRGAAFDDRTDQWFNKLAHAGLRAVAWFLFADGRGALQFDSAGYVTGVSPPFWGDYHSVLKSAAKHNLQLVWVLADFEIGMPKQTERGVQLFGRADLIEDPAKRRSLIMNRIAKAFGYAGVWPWSLQNRPDGSGKAGVNAEPQFDAVGEYAKTVISATTKEDPGDKQQSSRDWAISQLRLNLLPEVEKRITALIEKPAYHEAEAQKNREWAGRCQNELAKASETLRFEQLEVHQADAAIAENERWVSRARRAEFGSAQIGLQNSRSWLQTVEQRLSSAQEIEKQRRDLLTASDLRRDKALKLPLLPSPGRPYSAEEKAQMLEEAKKLRTPQMHAALALDLNTGLRDKELRQLRWEQIDLIHKKALTVGKSKTAAGTGRVIPLNETAFAALKAHAAWYTRRFGACRPEWFVFAFGIPLPKDPTRPITSFKTAWTKVRVKAGVRGRWHDNRHTLVTELAESGAGDEVIMSIAGHVSRAMLSRYSHVRMEAKRRALDEIASRQRTADEKRKQDIEQQRVAMASQALVVQ